MRSILLGLSGKVAPSIFNSIAPAQLDPAGTLSFPAGELRGMYSQTQNGNIIATQWKPKLSKFGSMRSGKPHNGVDIYAPVGTAIVAIFDGSLQCKADPSAEGLGNRAWLSFVIGGVNYRVIYGHLSRFEGTDRTVRKGEVIGYAGCSGNADYAKDCNMPGRCGVTSAYVHLMLKNDTANIDLDPITAFGWKLRYYDDERDVPCQQLMLV